MELFEYERTVARYYDILMDEFVPMIDKYEAIYRLVETMNKGLENNLFPLHIYEDKFFKLMKLYNEIHNNEYYVTK